MENQADYLQDIALFLGIGGYNGATVEQLVERIKNEFLRLSNLGRAQAKQIEALQADAERYRWIISIDSKSNREERESQRILIDEAWYKIECTDCAPTFSKSQIDAAIDAARKGNV
jgi:hypothetical protein